MLSFIQIPISVKLYEKIYALKILRLYLLELINSIPARWMYGGLVLLLGTVLGIIIDKLFFSQGVNELSYTKRALYDEIIIKGNALETGTYQIEIVNMQGKNKIVENWEVSNNGNKDFEFRVNTDNLNSGFYYVILRSPARVKAKSLFIIK